MKIKCFSKRKLNVRISKTKIKCAILGFSQNCCILGKSREKLVKFSKNSAKIQQILANFATFCKNQQKKSAIFNEKIELRGRCKGAHCVDLGGRFQTHIYLQNLASIRPRTILVKFARSPRTDPTGAQWAFASVHMCLWFEDRCLK